MRQRLFQLLLFIFLSPPLQNGLHAETVHWGVRVGRVPLLPKFQTANQPSLFFPDLSQELNVHKRFLLLLEIEHLADRRVLHRLSRVLEPFLSEDVFSLAAFYVLLQQLGNFRRFLGAGRTILLS